MPHNSSQVGYRNEPSCFHSGHTSECRTIVALQKFYFFLFNLQQTGATFLRSFSDSYLHFTKPNRDPEPLPSDLLPKEQLDPQHRYRCHQFP